ncbi:hypothetical protein M406DRAFT_347518 [Cryphonectria parasitica EP155]|uniref:F-box domain-containing protein n=1 Tax=Cryphonectria parasitica (strain ATCC 38755 / EP155) TaxID=660469 RepID=A0A9P4XW94_CRYP1|nr:uncharacterized protein M406DRAFT_347518 [Cryphonectria parasitica EP155]KAF3762444.1 hypothetical protein M406DRAFT_347518 [Cryphonectria parasitica EP155]
MSQVSANEAVVAVDETIPRRSSIEKPPVMSDSEFEDDDLDDDGLRPVAFHNLPEEIIQQILEVADPDAFASLILLNSKWRSASQQGHLYATQLMRCPSYSASHKREPDGKQENLPQLRKLFAREVKRNLFAPYLRPNHTEIKLVSNSISSSSCPGGDGMSFSPSPKGHYLLAYNSSRIHIIDLRCPTISVERELKILRRPVATCIMDDGSLLAVLLTEMQVDLYDLTQTPPKRTQSIILDHSPRAIALSPCGNVLAAAYEGGIEVQALNPGALATERRSVKCDGVDALAFSLDGTQILGTTLHSAQPSTVILTAPYYDPGAQMSSEDISALWTTSILFPNSSRDCSHAVLLQESSHDEAFWTFTYDRSFETFRAVRIDDLRNGTTYFTGPISNTPSKLVPCTLPSASYSGELVSAGFQGKEVWLYGIPEDLEAVPDTSSNLLEVNGCSEGVARSVSGSSLRSRPRTQEAGESRVPQWQLLCDRYRNTLVGGFKAAELSGVSTLKWVASFGDHSLKERLVITAKGATPAKPISMDDDGMDFEDGGRLTLVDFDYGLNDGCVNEITIEVGMKEPEILEEEHRDLETEVAIVRRRTVAQRRGNRSAMMRAATTAARPTPARSVDDHDGDDDDDPLLPRRMGAAPTRPRPASAATEETETNAVLEEVEALDAPYSHTGPRSISTLRRAATAAANHRQRNPTTSSGAPIEYRRADGRNEHPHESDADNWVPPPPPYQKEDPGETPAFLRHSMVPVIASARPHGTRDEDATAIPPVPRMPSIPPVPPIPQEHRPSTSAGLVGGVPAQSQERSSRRQTYMPDHTVRTPVINNAHHRLSSYPTMPSAQQQIPAASSAARTSHYDEDDIYNVSPPDTPRLQDSVTADNRNTDGSDISQTPVGPASDPSPSLSSTMPYTGTQRSIPLVPRIQTTATWPMPPPIPHGASTISTGYPLTAPATHTTMSDIAAHALPPPPPQELASEDRASSRQSSLARRISTGFHLPHHAHQAPDQPLIISTPTGIQAAYDAPTGQPLDPRAGVPIVAPVPRHPRPGRSPGIPRPAAERLESIYHGQQEQGHQFVPSFLSQPPAPSDFSTRNSSLNRRPSRAERSAAKNIADAKKKGWRPSRSKSRRARKSRPNEPEYDVMSQSAWTDITMTTAGGRATRPYHYSDAEARKAAKDKKCVVM